MLTCHFPHKFQMKCSPQQRVGEVHIFVKVQSHQFNGYSSFNKALSPCPRRWCGPWASWRGSSCLPTPTEGGRCRPPSRATRRSTAPPCRPGACWSPCAPCPGWPCCWTCESDIMMMQIMESCTIITQLLGTLETGNYEVLQTCSRNLAIMKRLKFCSIQILLSHQ